MKRKIVALTALALALGACTASQGLKTRDPGPGGPAAPQSQGSGAFDPLAGTNPALAKFYSQKPVWQDCGTNIQCTRVTVPLDYANPDNATIEIFVKRLTSAGENAPAIFMNPGGPGGSGTQLVEVANNIFNDAVLGKFNAVGFDPRGVEQSTAVQCRTAAEKDAENDMWIDVFTPAGYAELEWRMRDFTSKCVAKTGELLKFVDTVSAARDMDILRAVVAKADKLNYLGFSYGTYLGATFAEMFTARVGKFVLDGAVDPSLDIAALAIGQAMGFDRAVRSYMESCLKRTNCWHQGTVEEGLAKIRALWADVHANPRPTGDPARPLNASYALGGVMSGLSIAEERPRLDQGLDEAINKNRGDTLLALADVGDGRNPDGTYQGNLSDAFRAINCLDFPITTTKEEWVASAAKMKQQYPVFGDNLAWSEVLCNVWPHKSTRVRQAISANGSGPILVIGTTRDPATPYEWSERLAQQLDNGHLLTHEGDGHTAYGRNNCIKTYVNDYWLAGRIPPKGATCR